MDFVRHYREHGYAIVRRLVSRAELARLGRSGVPVYALYAPSSAGPTLLSEILSPTEVRGALAALPGH